MIRLSVRFRALALASALMTLGACASDSMTRPVPIAGTFRATEMIVAQPGAVPIDVVPLGGSLALTIADDNTTSGTLYLPANVTGGAPFSASMAGTAVREGDSFRLQQSADSFVRDLRWDIYAAIVAAFDQTAGGVRYTIVLERQ